MDFEWNWTLTSVIAVGVWNYNVMRNLKADLSKKYDQLDEKMFFLATGRKLEDAILERREKEKKE